jgi:predicted O-methyltransferase YrrM
MKYINQLPKHKYGWLPIMYSIVYQLRPVKIIEYGTEHGLTAITMGLALKDLQETYGHVGYIDTYDTFEVQSKGEIGSCPNFDMAVNTIRASGLHNIINVARGDFFDFCHTPNKQFDLLYFDIDNDGDKLMEMYEGCKELINSGSIVLFEGGSNTRDNVRWMQELQKRTMTSVQNEIGYQCLTDDTKYSVSIIYNPKKISLT